MPVYAVVLDAPTLDAADRELRESVKEFESGQTTELGLNLFNLGDLVEQHGKTLRGTRKVDREVELTYGILERAVFRRKESQSHKNSRNQITSFKE